MSDAPVMREAIERVERVAATDTTVLITGETGTGKELVARAIHRRSRRARHPLVAVNLSALPESLVSSELFGHEAGAFTGAVQRRIGRFEQADRSTLFLDEVGELPNEMQVSLLRVLQEGSFERLGSSQTRRFDVRVVAATNRDLDGDVDQQRFRADLFYRLNVFPIHLPPLRERLCDIPALVRHLLGEIAHRVGRSFTGIAPESLDRLQTFSWPGNVRQLENIVEQSAILSDGPLLEVPSALLVERHPVRAVSVLGAALEDSEHDMIESALTASCGRVAGATGAAARLGLPASTLESKIRKLQIDKLRFRTALRKPEL